MSKKINEEVFDFTAVKLRAHPTSDLRTYISKSIGHNRFLWNWALGLKKAQYDRWILKGKPEEFNWLNYGRLSAKLPKLKEQNPWLKEVSSTSLQQTLRHLDTAFNNWFKGTAKYPRFKGRSSGGSFHLPNNVVNNSSLKRDGKWLYIKLPKIDEELKCRLHRDLPDDGRILKAVISKSPSNQYFVSLMYEVPFGSLLRQSTKVMKSKCGIDLGGVQPLTVTWVNSEGEYKTAVKGLDLKRDLKKLDTRLKRYQRTFARRLESKKARQKDIKPNQDTGETERVSTKNLDKAKLKVASIYQAANNLKLNFAHKVSKDLATSFEVIKFEDLNLSGMSKQVKRTLDGSPRKNVAQKKGLNRVLLQIGLARIVSLTQYKSNIYGSQVKFVDPRYTSQRCSCCGYISKDNRTSQSDFECLSCGHTLNADTNASINILTRKPLQLDKKPRRPTNK